MAYMKKLDEAIQAPVPVKKKVTAKTPTLTPMPAAPAAPQTTTTAKAPSFIKNAQRHFGDSPGEFWRSKDWGGNLVYHPYWGWQKGTTIRKMYRKSSKGFDTPEEEIRKWGLTQNLGPTDWKKGFEMAHGMTTDQWHQKNDWRYANKKAGQQASTQTGGGGGQYPYDPNQNWAVGGIDPRSQIISGGAPGGFPPNGGGQIPPGTIPPGGSSVPNNWNEQDMLKKFGYTGEIGLNPYEKMALEFVGQMSQGGGPLATMVPGQGFYGDVLSGAYGPEGEAYRQKVYEATKAGALQNLGDLQKKTADTFANMGGYFGGEHALQQALLQERSANDLATTLANLNLEGYGQNMQNMMGAAGALPGMAGTQQNIVSDILNNMMTGGNMITQRELLNRGEYQNAEERAYQDWLRARQESMMPFNLALSLLGLQPFQNVVQQPSSSGWGSLLGGLGSGVGYGLGGPLGGALGGALGGGK